MKRIEIKKFVPKTVFKAVLFISAIPILFFIVVGIIGFAVGMPQNKDQSLSVTLLYLAFSPLLYGLIAMLLAASYNWLASKFGGLEMEIDEKSSEVIENKNSL